MSQQKRTDWRGQPIEVGTKVIYHRNHSGIATWGIGKVTAFRTGLYNEPLVDIEWEEHTGESRVARGVNISHCTVWHSSFTNDTKVTLREQLTEFLEISGYLDDQVIY